MSNVRVSVIIPAYNCEKHIVAAVESALNQKGVQIEVIVIDDCSTDRTNDRLRQFEDDSRVHVIRHDVNRGAAVARNNGIRAATGRFVAFLDSDDRWSGDKLLPQLEFMIKHKLALSYTTYDLIDEWGGRIGGSGELPASVDYQRLLRGCIIQNSTAMYDTDRTGGKVYAPNIRRRQDFGLFLEILRKGEVAQLVPSAYPTCEYRITPSGISHRKHKNIPDQWKVYRKVEGFSRTRSLYFMWHWFFYASRKWFRRFRQ